jgi:hypothetical protein
MREPMKSGVPLSLVVLTSTLGFPARMAALSWVEDILDDG